MILRRPPYVPWPPSGAFIVQASLMSLPSVLGTSYSSSNPPRLSVSSSQESGSLRCSRTVSWVSQGQPQGYRRGLSLRLSSIDMTCYLIVFRHSSIP
ncbi:hypothetical protein K466DRAFT_201037 [Polyporus arcularius HHB13444]|uniref:Uncharacterized protein n=1 Tax=Polyporus arcularius HHB13444 TaxID=1314778 RepID=A0A5C3PTJ5_9APHY|nr:hypothetical protein K466DRAFT_201037 [Polyporus arcularius HHB13444]